jgi:succinate dehydrogenase/fumarate reductase cytochrome b subunit
MAKKYSVNMENDEVVSVEVDGVRYDSPDQIPHEADRDKILELISKSTDEDFGKDFDQEFEAEFRALERQSAGAPKIIVAVFLAVGVLMLVIALISTVSTIRAIALEVSAPGQVVDMTVRQSRDSETQAINEYYYPVVEFDLPDGTPKRVQLSEGSWPPEYEVGQPVTVLYDPVKPLDARIKSTSSTILKWILPGITGIVGIVFLGITLLVRRVLFSDAS